MIQNHSTHNFSSTDGSPCYISSSQISNVPLVLNTQSTRNTANYEFKWSPKIGRTKSTKNFKTHGIFVVVVVGKLVLFPIRLFPSSG